MLSLTAKTIALHAAITHAIELRFWDDPSVFELPCGWGGCHSTWPGLEFDPDWYTFLPEEDVWYAEEVGQDIVGGEITIRCHQGPNGYFEVQCNAGTQHCYDDSEHYC